MRIAHWPAGQVGASLFGPGDEDWFQYSASVTIWGSIAPRADLTVVPGASSYELCLYMVCTDGEPAEIKSCHAGEEADGPGGLKGCCATDSVKLEIDCSGSSDDGTVFVHIKHLSGPWTCDPYAFQWGDD